jgi:hypothetical protein
MALKISYIKRAHTHPSEDTMASQDKSVNVYFPTITVRTSDGSTLQGKVYLTEKQRVSDLFTQSAAPFIVMVDVSHKEGEGKTLVINKDHIVWVEPEDA